MMGELVDKLVDFTDAELDGYLREQELHRRAVEARLAAAIAVADARGLHLADGHRSMRGYLHATCNWPRREVARFRGAARTVDACVEVGDAWLTGRIGSAQVHELSQVRTHRTAGHRFVEFAPTFVEHAEQLPHDDFTTVLQRFVNLCDADGRIDERAAIERRSATVADAAGELFVSMSGGDATTAAEFAAIVRRFEQAEFQADRAAQDADRVAGVDMRPVRTGPQRRFDAFVAMARAAASHTGVAQSNEPLVSVLIDQRTMRWVLAHSGLGAATSLNGVSVDPFTGLPLAADALDDLLGDPATFLDRRCETSTGVPLRASDVLRAVLSGHVRRVVLGAKRVVVDMGRSSRVFTGAARDAAMLLTTACDHPGCHMPASWCQVDHSTEWHLGGTTDQVNGGVECAHHNVEKHRRRRRTRRATNGRVHTFRSDGTIILPVGCRTPAFDDDSDDDSDLDAHGSLEDCIEPPLGEERMMIEAARARAALLAVDSLDRQPRAAPSGASCGDGERVGS